MKQLLVFISFVIFISCYSPNAIEKDFSCNGDSFDNLEKVNDVKNKFSMQLPKNWKTNLYYDNSLTSIFAADTTLSLTKTVLIDASLIHSNTAINNEFKQKISIDNSNMQLTETITKETTLFNKPSYYSYAYGKKGKFDYKILNIFSKVSETDFMHIKTEVYGDSLVDERICKALNLIKKIQVN